MDGLHGHEYEAFGICKTDDGTDFKLLSMNQISFDDPECIMVELIQC